MTTLAPPAPEAAGAAGADDEGRDSSPEELRSPTRTYHVIEERSLADLVLERLEGEIDQPWTPEVVRQFLDEPVYEPVTITEARNSEGALRSAAKAIIGRAGDVTLIPVSSRSWHPETVTIAVERIVTVGGR
jgi:hypothetical protein